MPGRMGGEMHTVQNLKIMKVDAENGIVVVSGCVPGPRYGMVKLQDALKKPWPEVDPVDGLSIAPSGRQRQQSESHSPRPGGEFVVAET